MRRRMILQRIFYRSIYILLYLILIGLLLITPGDIIHRSIGKSSRYNILLLALMYAATLLILAFVYATRLYVNKSALAAIPKPWVPIDRSDVKERVYDMISSGLNRSAAITFLSRPRGRSVADRDASRENLFAQPRVPIKTARTIGLELGVLLPARGTSWAGIEQPGWGAPDSLDLANLQYSTVLSELPNLIEAKALTLASEKNRAAAAQEDPQEVLAGMDLDVAATATALLQRDSAMSLRAYVDGLVELGVLDTEDDAVRQTVADFLTQYEYARFSTRAMSNSQFRSLMHLFAQLLRSMVPLEMESSGRRSSSHDHLGPSRFESDNDSDAPLGSHLTTPSSGVSRSMDDYGVDKDKGNDSAPTRLPLPRRNSSFNAWSQYATAPNTPGSRHSAIMPPPRRRSSTSTSTSTSTSKKSLVVARHATPASASRRLQQGPPLSLQRSRGGGSFRSTGSDSSASVIRLATREDSSTLPYILSLRSTLD